MGEHFNKIDYEQFDPGRGYTQLPISDPLFMTAVSTLELCSSLFGNCNRCGVKDTCRKLFDSLSNRCSDHSLRAQDMEWFKNRWETKVKSNLMSQIN